MKVILGFKNIGEINQMYLEHLSWQRYQNYKANEERSYSLICFLYKDYRRKEKI